MSGSGLQLSLPFASRPLEPAPGYSVERWLGLAADCSPTVPWRRFLRFLPAESQCAKPVLKCGFRAPRRLFPANPSDATCRPPWTLLLEGRPVQALTRDETGGASWISEEGYSWDDVGRWARHDGSKLNQVLPRYGKWPQCGWRHQPELFIWFQAFKGQAVAAGRPPRAVMWQPRTELVFGSMTDILTTWPSSPVSARSTRCFLFAHARRNGPCYPDPTPHA